MTAALGGKPAILVMYSNFLPSGAHLERLARLADGFQIFVATSEHEAVAYATKAEIILGHRYLRQALPHAKNLRWVQSTAAGVDHLASPELLSIAPILTRCPIFSDVIAQHAYALAWSVIRRIPEAVAAQARGEWARPFDMLPPPKVAMVLGMGQIGLALARLLKANGIRVIGAGRVCKPEMNEVCDEVLTGAAWREHLHRADLCFLALPLTQGTKGLFDDAAIRALPSHAVLVNIGRGATLDTKALALHLRKGLLGGAALDVLDEIPQPADDLWSTPRLLITPKVSAYHPEMQRKMEHFIEEQVARYLRGEHLAHQVDHAVLRESLVDY